MERADRGVAAPALAVDVSDTLAGLGHLRAGGVPRGAAAGAVALTGGYAGRGRRAGRARPATDIS